MITPADSVLDITRKLSLLTTELGVLDRIKNKLINEPDVAATHLATVLQELLKSLLLFESEVVRFLSLSFDSPSKIADDRALLHSLESQSLSARISEARGHCRKIDNIYHMYLNPWFQRVVGLKKNERKELARLFYSLSQSDSLMVDTLDAASNWLSSEAAVVLDLLGSGQIIEANMRIAHDRLHILPVRRVAAVTMQSLRELEAEFITMTRVT